MDPFAAALDALFNAPGSVAAVYYPTIGQPVPVRVIRSQPDEDVQFGATTIVTSTNVFEIRRSEVDLPERGALLMLDASIIDGVVTGGDQHRLQGEPMLDTEGMTWKIGAERI